LFLLHVALLAIVASVMQGIFVTALYACARTGTIPAAFNKDLLKDAFVSSPHRPGTI
jgi:hypothetical protein